MVAQDLGEEEHLWHPLSLVGRKGRGAMDSVMLMDELRKKTSGAVYGKDIKAAFNAVERAKVAEILEDTPDLADRFLEPRTFDIKIDRRTIGRTRMTGGTPQGSPLSPAIFVVYMSHMVTQAQQQIDIADKRKTRRQTNSHWPLWMTAT